MAMQQLQLASQKHSASWLKIFPRDIKTLAGSTIFVKQLTALAFSCITYMRSIFPEYSYEERELDDVKVKILSGNYNCKDAYLMTRWIKSAFNALDNKYMRELVLEILSADNKPLEYYAVMYKYTDRGPSCSISASGQSKEIDFDVIELQNATKALITKLLTVTECLGKLPTKYTLQLRINYYDEITPAQYKPKYFDHAEPCDLQKLENMKHEVIGSVETPYLALSIYNGSKLISLEDREQNFFKDMEEENSLCIEDNNGADRDTYEKTPSITTHSQVNTGTPSITTHSQVNTGTPSITTHSQVNTGTDVNESEYTWTYDKSANSLEGILEKQEPVASSMPIKANCICGHTYETDKDSLQNSSDTFKCISCNTHQHLVCYKKIPDCRDLELPCCYSCAKIDRTTPIECTDPSLMKYKPRQAKHLAIYRQIVYRFQNRTSISLKTLYDLGIKNDLANNMISKLKQEFFIKPKKKKGGYKEDAEKLQEEDC